MLLIVAEHLNEIKPFLDSLPFKKEGELYRYDNIVVFVNHGRGGLSLGFKVSQLLERYDVSIALLFGFAGGICNVKPGEFVFLERVKLFDNKAKPLFNPVELTKVYNFKTISGITLLDGFNFDNGYLSLFGDCIDREAYFFAKALSVSKSFGLILKVISDRNSKADIERLRLDGFKYDVEKLKALIFELAQVEKDPIFSEAFRYTGFFNIKILDGIKRLIEAKHLSFSRRQMLYKKIIINNANKKTEPMSTKTVFIEKGVDTSRIKIDLNSKRLVYIDDYVPYFHNLKDRAAVIFANKKGEFLRKTPDNYTPDGGYGYSLLGSYNCIYDCSYCFLKGYFKSFNPVVFLNYQDYFSSIAETLKKDKKRPLYFYAGSFSDPVALSVFSDFYVKLVEFFSSLEDRVFLEIRTKSSYIKPFLSLKPSGNVVFAFSVSPNDVCKTYEAFTPKLSLRLEAIKRLDDVGFLVGIRIDPVIVEHLEAYEGLFDFIDGLRNLHSVEIGFLRFDKNDYKTMLKKSPSILRGLVYENSMYRYPYKLRKKALSFFESRLKNFYVNMEY
ncbi:SPL family radical SAM protein [Hippea maritima]|uniref:Radical SAM domain protein n=1 Tax=Hippea maritima (strain ATCC 700847 / DSM 10411 / MH2) TaxID=760142 RepID=F2LWV6_HIPMA|nr:radical SAM protein [Hippea maritima]AEA34140.1 Radical SAM domain protein [Hippea maritima DSM 10411]